MLALSKLSDLPPLKDLLIEHDLWAKKSLGQNFLLDPNITETIAKKALINDRVVLEIGPGPGGLTRGLLNHGAKQVFAVEKDVRCIHLLQSLVSASEGRLHLIEKDALKFKLSDFVTEYSLDAPFHIVANLPYNIGTQLLLNWFKDLDWIGSMTLMFQKEVAERMVATPGTDAYGRLSILCQYLCMCKIIMHLPPSAFTPAPKVHSAVIQLVPKKLSDEEKKLLPLLERVTALAFGQRRKMLKSSLKSLLKENEIEALGISPTMRPEELALDSFLKICKKLI